MIYLLIFRPGRMCVKGVNKYKNAMTFLYEKVVSI